MNVTSGCLILLPDKKIVFQRRTKDAPISAHMLDFFGGHAEPGESHIETMRRELTEETSLDADDLDIKYRGKFNNPTTGLLLYLYTAHLKKPDFEVYEGEKQEIYDLDGALARNDLDPDTRLLLEEYKKTESN